jgi:hypothetical protein
MLTQPRVQAVALLGTISLFAAVAARGVDPADLARVRRIDASTPKDVQIALALSAGPPVSKAATVYVIGPKGYEKAQAGTNGFTCLVERQPIVTVCPICYDAEGTATLVPVDLFVESERARGQEDASIGKAIAEGYKSGLYKAPRKGGIAYMLSDYNYLIDPPTKKVIHVPGHVMFYAPYATADDVGRGPGTPDLTDPGQPDNCMAVTPAPSPHADRDHH